MLVKVRKTVLLDFFYLFYFPFLFPFFISLSFLSFFRCLFIPSEFILLDRLHSVGLLRKSNRKKPEEVEAAPSLKLQNIFT